MPAPATSPPTVAILAGGLATRMQPLTEKVPKCLLPVAGRPFLSHQLALLRKQGIAKAVLCVGHLGELIQENYGQGEGHGIALEYSFDGPNLLGTGGAIKKALPLLGSHFYVLYGDSYLPVEFSPIEQAFYKSGCSGLMTVFKNEGRYDTSNVWFENGRIKVYDKTKPLPEMRYIDFGLSIFRATAFSRYAVDQPFDLASVLQDLVSIKDLAGYEINQRFYEIGSHEGLRELEALLNSNPTP